MVSVWMISLPTTKRTSSNVMCFVFAITYATAALHESRERWRSQSFSFVSLPHASLAKWWSDMLSSNTLPAFVCRTTGSGEIVFGNRAAKFTFISASTSRAFCTARLRLNVADIDHIGTETDCVSGRIHLCSPTLRVDLGT